LQPISDRTQQRTLTQQGLIFKSMKKLNLLEYPYLQTTKDFREITPTDLFDLAWNYCSADLKLSKEYLFAYPRKYRADYAHKQARVLIDIQGGVYARGNSGHSSGVGISRDCEKLLYAQILGFKLFYLTKEMITIENISAIRDCIAEGI
jgi:hypothetical protein